MTIIMWLDNISHQRSADQSCSLLERNRMKNILVPCDFSKPAEQAFKFAVEIVFPVMPDQNDERFFTELSALQGFFQAKRHLLYDRNPCNGPSKVSQSFP